MLKWNAACVGTLSSTRHCKEPRRFDPTTYSEVIHETQPSLVVHERTSPRCLHETAVNLQCPCRFHHHGSGGFFQLDVEHATRGSVQPVHNPAGGFEQQRISYAAPG
jgi:hypothetical protein